MARTAVPVDKNKLIEAINTVEANGPKENRNELYLAVAEEYNKGNPEKEISHSIVYLRVRDWNIQVKTPIGKRGRKKGESVPRGERVTKAEKFAANPKTVQSLRAIERTTPQTYKRVAEKIGEGSMKAAIRLKCLECCGFNRDEAKNCGIIECSLYPFNPYRS